MRKQPGLRVSTHKSSSTKQLRFTGVYEYHKNRTLKEVMEHLVGCGIHNIEIIKEAD